MVVVGWLVATLWAGPSATAPDPEPPKVLRPTLGPRWRAKEESRHSRALQEQADALGLRRKGSGWQRERDPGVRFDAFVRADGEVVFDLDDGVMARVDGVCAFALCIGGVSSEPTEHRRKKLGVLAARIAEAAILGTANAGPWGYGTPVQGPLPGTRTGEPPPYPILTAVGRYGALPAPVAEMSEFMNDTFAFRVALASDDAERRLSEAYEAMIAELAAVWISERTAAQKREAVLRLWSEVDAADPPRDVHLERASDLDVLRTEAARRSRRAIVGSIREHAPRGSAEGFTPAQLRRFNESAQVPLCPYEAHCNRDPGSTSDPHATEADSNDAAAAAGHDGAGMQRRRLR